MLPSMVAAIDDFRFDTRCKSQSEAVRALVERGLASWREDKTVAQTSESADANPKQPAPTEATNTHSGKEKAAVETTTYKSGADD